MSEVCGFVYNYSNNDFIGKTEKVLVSKHWAMQVNYNQLYNTSRGTAPSSVEIIIHESTEPVWVSIVISNTRY